MYLPKKEKTSEKASRNDRQDVIAMSATHARNECRNNVVRGVDRIERRRRAGGAFDCSDRKIVAPLGNVSRRHRGDARDLVVSDLNV
jgi:hypothetical protein